MPCAEVGSDNRWKGDVDMRDANEVNKKESHLKPGVKKTECFDFDEKSPYFHTHELRPRTKIILPKLQPTPPR